jgi:putative transposase
MAGTFSQIHLQIVFAVKGRQPLLLKPWREELFKFISGIIANKGHKAIIVGGVEDHIHIFIGFKPTGAISDLVRDIKASSSKWINEQILVPGGFEWQGGYGVFSYARSQVEAVYHYIENQEEHHRKKTFKQEYVEFMQEFEVEYEDRFLFD